MIQRKLKTCKTCKEPKYLWAYDNCKECDAKVKSRGTPIHKVAGKTYKKVEIKPISDKQSKLLAEYRKVRDAFMKERPFCEICGSVSTDTHHRRGRGKYLTDVSTFMAVCRRCHEKIEREVSWAYENGYSLSRLE